MFQLKKLIRLLHVQMMKKKKMQWTDSIETYAYVTSTISKWKRSD